jgi:hypothetical protein
MIIRSYALRPWADAIGTRSAIIMVVALVWARITSGITKASATRGPSRPPTRPARARASSGAGRPLDRRGTRAVPHLPSLAHMCLIGCGLTALPRSERRGAPG